MINGNRKGKAGERELAAILRSRGYQARRAQQYCGKAGTEDITHDLPGVYLECKRERLNVLQAYNQARRDNQDAARAPVVAHRVSKSPWLVTLSLDDFLLILRGEGLIE